MVDLPDDIKDSFCIAKWKHSTLHLGLSETHSCYHPPMHRMKSFNEIDSLSDFHNTDHKVKNRKRMLKGIQVHECEHCWYAESLGNVSDRQRHNKSHWGQPHISSIISDNDLGEDVIPSYLEVSFSNLCNMKCSYCSPGASSRWSNDIRLNGGYRIRDETLQYDNMRYHIPEHNNALVHKFLTTLPDAIDKIKILRITGGEPLQSRGLNKVIKILETHPNANLEFSVNTNLSGNHLGVHHLIESFERLQQGQKIKKFSIFTSIDAWGNEGHHAAYIRSGMDVKSFETNLQDVLDAGIPVIIMATFGVMSINTYKTLLEKVKEWKTIGDIIIDPTPLYHPAQFDIKMLNNKFKPFFDEISEFMESNKTIFSQLEHDKWQMVQSYWENNKQFVKDDIDDLRTFIKTYEERDTWLPDRFENLFPEINEWILHGTSEADYT